MKGQRRVVTYTVSYDTLEACPRPRIRFIIDASSMAASRATCFDFCLLHRVQAVPPDSLVLLVPLVSLQLAAQAPRQSHSD
ncbi:g2071 [Coccomyxa elongata]